MLVATERRDEANPVHTTGTTAGGPRRGSLRPVVGVRWHEGPNPHRREPPVPESASRRHRRWPAGGPCALLAAIVLVLTVVAAGPGGAELAVVLASSAAAGLVGLALAAPGLVGAGPPPDTPGAQTPRTAPWSRTTATRRRSGIASSPVGRLLGRRLVQLGLSQQLLEPGVLGLRFLEPPRVGSTGARVGPPPPVQGRPGDLHNAAAPQPGRCPSRASAQPHEPCEPPALWRMPSPLRCGHPPIVGGSDPQHADSNQRPTSDGLIATQEPKYDHEKMRYTR